MELGAYRGEVHLPVPGYRNLAFLHPPQPTILRTGTRLVSLELKGFRSFCFVLQIGCPTGEGTLPLSGCQSTSSFVPRIELIPLFTAIRLPSGNWGRRILSAYLCSHVEAKSKAASCTLDGVASVLVLLFILGSTVYLTVPTGKFLYIR